MPLTIEVHQGSDSTALAMLVATICLLLAAVAQATAALRQASAANRQAKAADRQAEAADKQADAAQTALDLSIKQVHSSIAVADNSALPMLHIAFNVSAPMVDYYKLTNSDLGPAERIQVGPRNLENNMIDQAYDLDVLFLGVGENVDIPIPKTDLRGDGVIVHYESVFNTKIDSLITVVNENPEVKKIRVVQLYKDLLDISFSQP
jgi:hypothetical protein